MAIGACLGGEVGLLWELVLSALLSRQLEKVLRKAFLAVMLRCCLAAYLDVMMGIALTSIDFIVITNDRITQNDVLHSRFNQLNIPSFKQACLSMMVLCLYDFDSSIDNQTMKIIPEFYMLTFGIILICLPISFYLKLTEPNIYTYNIAIYGDTIDTSMLAYYIDQHIQEQLRNYERVIRFNITLISTPQANSNHKDNHIELNKEVNSFCGVEKEWMKLVENTNLKYSIKEYGVYFGENIEGTDKNQFRIYSTSSSLLNSMMEYGLSKFAAYNFFLKFAKSINQTHASATHKKHRIEDLTTSNIIKSYFPNPIEEDSIKYFSETLGLDQKYINQFISPVIMGNYLHQANSLSALYKLLPVYCHNYQAIGKSLAIFEEPQKIQQKILGLIQTVKLNFLPKKQLETYSIIKDKKNQKKKYVNVILSSKHSQEQNTSSPQNDTMRVYLKSDVFFIFDDYDSVSTAKQYSCYKTVIDGKIKNDERYEEFFTIYIKANTKKKEDAAKEDLKTNKLDGKQGMKGLINPIYSITRVCAFNCKGYENSIYILISKHRLVSSKHLEMFESHDIKSYKKISIEKSQLPTSKKLQENENVYKLYNIESISDSYELQLNLVKEISQSLISKIKKEYDL